MGRPIPCGANTRAGAPCAKRPVPGGIRCKFHGGAAPAAKAKAAERVLEAKVRKLVPDAVGPMENPLLSLLTVAAEAEAFKDALRELVGDLGDRIRYSGLEGGEQLRAEVVVYERALDRVGRMCVDIAKLGLEERLVRQQEALGAGIVAVLSGALADLGLDAGDERVRGVVAVRLRELTGGPSVPRPVERVIG